MSPTALFCQSIRLLTSIVLAVTLIILILSCAGQREEEPLKVPSQVQKRYERTTTTTPKLFPKLAKSVLDCGKFPKTTWKWNNENSRGMTLSSLKYLKVFSSPFTTTYICLRSTNISEQYYRDKTSQKTEVRTIFYLDLSSLHKMKRSLLSVQATSQYAGTINGVTAFIFEERATAKLIPRVEVERQSEDGIINFDTSDFLAGVRMTQLPAGKKITVNFILWYESNSIGGNGDYEGPFLNTSFHVPSLRLFYTL